MGHLRLLRNPQIRALWAAQTLSVLGDRLYALAIMWVAWRTSGAVAMGLVAIAESVPYVVMGTIGTRMMARFAGFRPLAAVDVLRAVAVAVLPTVSTTVGTPGMLTMVAVLGVAGAIFDPNLGALVPELVDERDVRPVTALMDLTGRIARVAGPASAGVLLAVVPQQGLFVLDGVTFAVSAAALAWLARITTQPSRPQASQFTARRASSVPRAWALLRAHPQVGFAIGVHAGGIFLSAVALGMPILLAYRLHAGLGTYGVVMACTGAGALVGNVLAGNLRLVDRFPASYCAAWLADGLLLVATGLATSLPVIIAVAVAGGIVTPFMGVSLQAHLSRHEPGVRLRLMTLDQTVIRAAGLTGCGIIPALIADDPAAGYVIGGLATGLLAAAGWTAATVATVRTRPAGAPATPLPELVRD